MLQKILNMAASKWYWLSLLLLGFVLEGIALFYQYGLDYMPCVLCIHYRIWVLGMIAVSAAALLVYKHYRPRLFMLSLMTSMGIGMLERAWLLLGTERGFIAGACSMDSGLPPWFALDEWFPAVFEVQEPCGYTPELLFGVTMAEALIVFSIILITINAILLLNYLQAQFRK